MIDAIPLLAAVAKLDHITAPAALRVLKKDASEVSVADLCAAAIEATRALATDAGNDEIPFVEWAARRGALEALSDGISGEMVLDEDTGELIVATCPPDIPFAICALAAFWSA